MDFADLERQAWGDAGVAKGYETHFSAITAATAPALLDACGVRKGLRLLDVATGPGPVARAAAARGAEVTGLDFSPAMVDLARALAPALRFERGDAQALPFPEGSFDAVTCNFGLLHFPDPDAALREASRVLAPGGRAAWTVWGTDAALLAVFPQVVKDLGLDPRLPPGPPFFRFAQPGAFEEALRAAGLEPFPPGRVAWEVEVPSVQHLLRMYAEGTARTRATLLALAPEDRARLEKEMGRRLEGQRRGGAYRIQATAVVGAGRKPA